MLRTYGFVPSAQPQCDNLWIERHQVIMAPNGLPAWAANNSTEGLREALLHAQQVTYAGPCVGCVPEVQAVYDNARAFVDRALAALDREL